MFSSLRSTSPALSVLAFVLAACGGDDGTSGPTAPTERGRVVMIEGFANGSADASAGSDRKTEGSNHFSPPFEPLGLSHQVQSADQGATGSGSSTLTTGFDFDSSTGELRSFTFSATAAGSGTQGVEDVTGCGGGNTGAWVVFEVLDARVGYVIEAEIVPGHNDGDVTVRLREADPDGGWLFPHVFVGTASFSTTGDLGPGRYMIQVWCQAAACSSNFGSDATSLNGSFTFVDAP